MYRGMKGIDKIDKRDLFVWDERDTRGHNKKLKKTRCLRDVKKYSFPYRCIDVWKNLPEEIIEA